MSEEEGSRRFEKGSRAGLEEGSRLRLVGEDPEWGIKGRGSHRRVRGGSESGDSSVRSSYVKSTSKKQNK